MTLGELYDRVVKEWPFDANSYPELEGASPEKVVQFALNHLLKHQQKGAGTLATFLERADHGYEIGAIERGELESLAAKMIVSGLRLAEVLGVSVTDIEKDIQKMFQGVSYTRFKEPRTGEQLHRSSKGF